MQVAFVTLVCGPPCAGKNTYVRAHAAPSDLVVDLDALLVALGAPGSHDHPPALMPFAFEARDAVVQRLFSGRHRVGAAWVIASAPTRRHRLPYHDAGHRVVLCDPGRDVAEERAGRERPAPWLDYIDTWYAAYEPDFRDQIVATATGGPLVDLAVTGGA